MLASDAARAIIQIIEQGRKENYIGKSKLLAVLMRILLLYQKYYKRADIEELS